ncbi:hypothetical protein C4569_02420 [Candidatus Parcubacteria bacterium]|nr:MAG: hypothetical protein C4569_02420 [Candidatus Parcubacteria bacterium]
MPKFLHLTKNKKTICCFRKKTADRVSLKKINFILFVFAFAFFVGYLTIINSLATKSYVISELEAKKAQISQENSRLQSQMLTLQSGGNIENKLDNLQMVASKNIEYLNVQKPQVAVR